MNRKLTRLCALVALMASMVTPQLWAFTPPVRTPEAPAARQDAEKQAAPIIGYESIFQPVVASRGMVASEEAVASAVGADMLARGGNAVDAAVAVAFVLSVTLPKAGNLGGGGFMLVHLAETGKTLTIDYREVAPALAHRDMFLDADGNVDKHRIRKSHKAAGVPGTVAGLTHAQEKYGSLPLTRVMAPAISLAREGIPVSRHLAADLDARRDLLLANPEAARIFFKADGSAYQVGELLRRPDLASSLELIAEQGADAFYRGEIARKLVAEMEAHEGLIGARDLAAYRVVERAPVTGNYRGYEIVSMPPPSSGGIHLVQMLNVLEQFPLAKTGLNSAASVHLITETMKYAFADRSKYLGDPDFVKVPIARLTSKAYARTIAGNINSAKPTPSREIQPGALMSPESPDTTHISVIDQWGNAVSSTYTLNFSFGSGIVAKGTGILLNNEMDDFSAKPGVPNAYGLLGNDANAVAPGRRPLSSMTPTMVFRDGKPWLVTGSPGGSVIITSVLQILLNVLDFDLNIAEASVQPRFHHQWFPDVLYLEPTFPVDTRRLLEQSGYRLENMKIPGRTQSVMWDGNLFRGYSDPRRAGAATIGVD